MFTPERVGTGEEYDQSWPDPNSQTNRDWNGLCKISVLYAVRNWKIDFLQQTHISQARNWMVAIGLVINKIVSLHRCNCG